MLRAGWHVRQALVGSAVPAETQAPPMRHWFGRSVASQLPVLALQASVVQDSPSSQGFRGPKVQPAAVQVSPVVQASLSLQAVGLGVFVQPDAAQASVVQATPSVQAASLGVATHAPAWQVSTVQAMASAVQVVPFGRGDHALVLNAGRQARHGLAGSDVPSAMQAPLMTQLPVEMGAAQLPVAALHASVVHGRPSSQTLRGAITQPCAAQASPTVQASPSSQAASFGVWRHAPAWHVSTVHATPSVVHGAPFGRVDQAVVLVAGRHARHGSVGWLAPAATHTPSMRHVSLARVFSQPEAVQRSAVQRSSSTHATSFGFEAHAPPSQSSAVHATASAVHAVPFGRGDQTLVLTAGWQDWHSLPGERAPAVMQLPPMRHAFA